MKKPKPKLTDHDWRNVFAARCKSKQGQLVSDDERDLMDAAYSEDPTRYEELDVDVFNATVPFGSTTRKERHLKQSPAKHVKIRKFRDTRPYFSFEDPHVPYDEMVLATIISIAGMNDQTWHRCSKNPSPSWDFVETEIQRYLDNGSVRNASAILRRGSR